MLPLPVTALSVIIENDINIIAAETTRSTGKAAATNSSPCPKTDRKISGNRFNSKQTTTATPVLSLIIFFKRLFTCSFLPCPIILLTMALVVAAKAQVTQPNTPNIFRITLETFKAMSP